MPLPKPGKTEKQDDFMGRCMSDAKGEFSDQAQRTAVCMTQWRSMHSKAKKSEMVKASFRGMDVLKVPWNLALATATDGRIEVGSSVGDDGIAHKLYRKEIIRDGAYIKEDDGISFRVTPALRDHWAMQFARMRDNGVKIPIVEDHIDGVSDKSHGWIRELQNEGNSLFMVVEVIGDEGIALASRNDVSLFSPPAWKDGKGNEYVRPIKHVSFTPTPVIPGLTDFEVIAASFSKETDMADLSKFKEVVDLADGQEFTDETAVDLVLGTLENRKKRIALLEAEIALLKKSVASVKASQAPTEKPDPDPLVLSMASENRQIKLMQLMELGAIDANARKRLEDLYVGADGASLKLSLKGGTSDHFDDLLKILRDNKPVSLGEKTGAQVLQLAHAVTDAKRNPLLADADRRREQFDAQFGRK